MVQTMFWVSWLAVLGGEIPSASQAGAVRSHIMGNRLGYLEAFCEPFYPELGTPRLATPQWVGVEGVEAVVVLAIDDLRFAPEDRKRPEHYEAYLRPIMERLKKMDGRAPVSLMTTWFDQAHPLFGRWLEEGCTLEVHTRTHFCPLLQKQDFAGANASFQDSVDRLAKLPGNRPVAFRMPCCDSMHSPSPRFYAEIFNQRTREGRFLQVDSSVFLLFTSQDPALPRQAVFDEAGQERFRKYLPKDRLMGNYVENYPYPWVIDRLCWEVPAVVPSDWQAFHAQGGKNPKTLQDWKSAVDLVVAKQGVWALCFHPYEWIANHQVLELVEYAASKYPGRVLFLNFREVVERLTQNALGGVPLRSADGQDNGVRLLDLNADGWMDVVIGNAEVRQTRVWSPQERRWIVSDFPVPIVQRRPDGKHVPTGVRFGVLRADGMASILVRNEIGGGLWHFDGNRWVQQSEGLSGLEIDQPEVSGQPLFTCREGRDQGARLWDIDGDGRCELIVGGPTGQAVFRYQEGGVPCWQKLPYRLPEGSSVVDAQGRDAGLRLVDLNGDGKLDVVFSDVRRYGIYLFASAETGWSRTVVAAQRSDPEDFAKLVASVKIEEKPASAKVAEKPVASPAASTPSPPLAPIRLSILPPFVRADGTNNGVSFGHRALWVQNEDTGGRLPHHVARWTFEELLRLGKTSTSAQETNKADNATSPILEPEGSSAPSVTVKNTSALEHPVPSERNTKGTE